MKTKMRSVQVPSPARQTTGRDDLSFFRPLLQRDLRFPVFRRLNSSSRPISYSGICVFRFSAASILLLTRFLTAGFVFSGFPPPQFFFSPDFLQRDLRFPVFRRLNSSSHPISYSEICVFRFSAASILLLTRFLTAGFAFSGFPPPQPLHVKNSRILLGLIY